MVNLSFIPEKEIAENGIFKFFRKKHAINRLVTTFGSLPYLNTTAPDNILTLSPKPFYASQESLLGLEVGFTFPDHEFTPIAFTICQYIGYNYTLQEFALEASNSTQEDNWEEIYITKVSTDQCIPGSMFTFYIDKNYWKPFKRFRIRNKGPNCPTENQKYHNSLRLGGIELFGQLSGSCQFLNPCSCVIKSNQPKLFLSFTLVLLKT